MSSIVSAKRQRYQRIHELGRRATPIDACGPPSRLRIRTVASHNAPGRLSAAA